jgi:hypothetical protein
MTEEQAIKELIHYNDWMHSKEQFAPESSNVLNAIETIIGLWKQRQESHEFQVYALQTVKEGKENKYSHWADGLTMYIAKDGTTMKLNENEIQKVVKALPKTIGGTY